MALLILCLLLCGPAACSRSQKPQPQSAAQPGQTWPQFRGPGGTGAAPAGESFPRDWDGATGRGILWKAALPAGGHSSPIVWGDRLFLTGEANGQCRIVCFSCATGDVLWDLPAVPTPEREMPAMSGGLCAPTPATDGERVYALFATGDVVCADFAGHALWKRHLCDPVNSFGLCSSPILWKETVILQLDQGNTQDEGLSVLVALDKRSGNPLWSTERSVPNSWSTPILIEHAGRHELITCANPFVITYDPDTGREFWRVKGLDGEVVPMPAYSASAGLVFAANAGASLLAIAPGGSGDVTGTRVAWTAKEGLPSMASPLTDGRRLLLCAEGDLTCYDANAGTLLWRQKAGESFWASPALAGGAVYLPEQMGKVFIFEIGEGYKLLSRPDVKDEITASPAFAGGRIYLRTRRSLFCIGSK